MNKRFRVPWRLLVGCLMFLFIFSYSVASTAVYANQVSATLDGVRDAGYVLIATDPSGDLAGPGPADWTGTQWTDLTAMYVAADASNLYVYIDLPGYFFNSGDTGNDSSGQIGLAIETDGAVDSGGSGDAWGTAVTFNFTDINGFTTTGALLPDYLVRGNVSNDGGWTELRSWNGSWNDGAGTNWGGISGGEVGTHVAYSFNNGVEFAIPWADIGNPDPAHVKLQFFATQDGGGKGAYDSLSSDAQSGGWDDATELAKLVTVPLAIDAAGDLASPGPADWNGVTWTDVTRLHTWADDTNLYLYIPSAAYDTVVSSGQIGLAIDTQAGGGSSDPWGNAITFAYANTNQNLGQDPVANSVLPDYVIRGNVFGPDAFGAENGWTEFRIWNGSDWNTGSGFDWGGIGNTGAGSQPGSKVAWTNGDGLRLTIPLTDINVAGNDVVSLQFFGTQGGGGKGAYDTVPSDDQSTGWDDPTTQATMASFIVPDLVPPPPPPPGECGSGAAQDDNIFWADLGHNSRDTLYRTPGGAVEAGTAVTLRLRTACDDLTAAQVRIWDDRVNVQTLLDMELVAGDNQYDWWEAGLPISPDPTIYWYRFIATDGSSVAYYEDDDTRDGGWGQTFGSSPDNGWQLSMYDPTFQTPDWVKNGIVYQIFPERFRDGNAANNTPAGSFHYDIAGGSIVRSNGTGWHTPICDPRNPAECDGIYGQNFYGGDLQGIIDKLDYLQDLGVTALYLNPIFESPSNHKYDTTDFGVIDDNFGDLATFQLLATEAENRDISIVLDGVFNHTSSDSIYFDRYNRYTPPDGACESETSSFRNWYYFSPAAVPGTGPCAGDATYEAWFGFDSLPKLNAGNADVRDLIWSGGSAAIARYWLDQGADGWRLDVAGDVDPGLTNDPANDYWEGFRDAVHTSDPDAYIVGEEWNVATAWTLGQEWDATMNYQFSSAILSFWRDETFVDNDHNTGSSAGELAPLTPSQLDARLHNLEERYPPEAFYAMINLLGSHDTNRALFLLDHNTDLQDDTLYDNPNYDWSDAITRLKGVVLLQMTLPGAPTIYYGDEVGLVGPVTWDGSTWQDDPYNRLPFPWLDETGTPYYTHLQSQTSQDSLRDYYKLLTGTRLAHPALRTGSFDTLLVDDGNHVYGYGRLLADYSDAAVIVINRAGAAQDVTVDVSGYLPVGMQLVDALNGGTYTVDGSGQLTVTGVPAMNGAVLVLDGAMTAPPAAVTDLAVTDVRPHEVDLSWTAAAGADSYDVYRSLVSGGGYTFVANTTGTGFTGTGLLNAVDYYYMVASRNDTTLLVGGASDEVSATPAYDLSTAWFNLQWPSGIVHTISTINRTENIYGQLWIDGVTVQPGPADGIMAQVGFGPDGSPPDSSWTWEAMTFNTDAGNNDEYVGSLLPEMLGTYDYVTRYSSDGGATWFYADLNGPGINGNPGDLQVVASSDTIAPAVPTGLVVTGTTESSVGLTWNANGEADLAGYEVYRENAGFPGFVKITSVGAGATAFDDNSVATGETYNYYVVAFDTSFNRSAASNIVNATAELRMVTITFNLGVPDYTPGTVYIVGSIDQFGPWNPGLVPMTQVDATTWTHTLDILDGTLLDFKFTRGNWETVEAWGNIVGLANRQVLISYGTDGTQVVDLTATDWGNGPDDQKAVQLWRDPIVVDHSPADGAIDVVVDTAVTVRWSLPMDVGTSFDVTGPDGTVAGSFSYDAGTDTTTFTPDVDLVKGATYTVSVSGQGSNGNGQQVPVIFSFTTVQPTPEEMIDALIADIHQLVADGEMYAHDGRRLVKRLIRVKQMLRCDTKLHE